MESMINYQVLELKSNEELLRLYETCQLPIVLYFYATWCNTCKLSTPIIQDRMKYIPCIIVKIQIDNFPDLAEHYRVSVVPNAIVYIDGKQTNNFKMSKNSLVGNNINELSLAVESSEPCISILRNRNSNDNTISDLKIN